MVEQVNAGPLLEVQSNVDVDVAPTKSDDKSQKPGFRDYEGTMLKRVEQHYRMMRSNQTVEFVQRMHAKYSFENGAHRARLSIREAVDALQSYVDSSDPDLGLPNIVHAFQTAEGIREAGHPDWLQVVGLLHDFGKIMFLWGREEDGQVGTAEGPQWALGGDTWVVGCPIPECIVHAHFNDLNPDASNPLYNSSPTGMYEPGCGLDKTLFSYGHDEYMYQMLVANETTLPEEGLKMVRYHSAYCWHEGGAYRALMNSDDHQVLPWVKLFNQFDLYTKDEGNNLSVEELWLYYEGLIDKYLPGDSEGKLRW